MALRQVGLVGFGSLVLGLTYQGFDSFPRHVASSEEQAVADLEDIRDQHARDEVARDEPVRDDGLRDEVAAYFAKPEHVRWTKAARLFLDGPESCVDGRDPSKVVAAPGGDAGEFILSLSVIEQRSGREFSAAEVDELMSKHLEAFGRFYLHTDEKAIKAVAAELMASGELGSATHPEAFVRNPPPHLRARLLDLLVQPSGIGCGHLRLLVTRADDYEVRRELVEDVLRAFFRELWQRRDGVQFVVLAGDHHERAVIEVHVPAPLHPFSTIPLVEPHDGKFEAFVYHPEVTEWLRREHAAFFLENVRWLPGVISNAELESVLAEQGKQHLALTLEALAGNLPHFDLVSTRGALELRNR